MRSESAAIVPPSLEEMMAGMTGAASASATRCHNRLTRYFHGVLPITLAVTKASLHHDQDDKDWKKTTVVIRSLPGFVGSEVPKLVVEWSGGGDAVVAGGMERGEKNHGCKEWCHHRRRIVESTPGNLLRPATCAVADMIR